MMCPFENVSVRFAKEPIALTLVDVSLGSYLYAVLIAVEYEYSVIFMSAVFSVLYLGFTGCRRSSRVVGFRSVHEAQWSIWC